MGKNFFWWSYEDKYESRRENSVYIYNPHEVEMVVSLCCWLVCNEVPATNIAVLTPYRGQVGILFMPHVFSLCILYCLFAFSWRKLKNPLKKKRTL